MASRAEIGSGAVEEIVWGRAKALHEQAAAVLEPKTSFIGLDRVQPGSCICLMDSYVCLFLVDLDLNLTLLFGTCSR